MATIYRNKKGLGRHCVDRFKRLDLIVVFVFVETKNKRKHITIVDTSTNSLRQILTFFVLFFVLFFVVCFVAFFVVCFVVCFVVFVVEKSYEASDVGCRS
jgi:hypothetical protein